MKSHARSFVLLVLILAAAAGCNLSPPEKKAPSAKKRKPDYVVVQHILVSRSNSKHTPGRSPEDAEKLAHELLARAKGGEDFDALVKEYTDDQVPGIYSMNDVGMPSRPARGSYGADMSRSGMVSAFGDLSFGLEVGEIGMTDYDEKASPFGWHIIKRIE